MEKIIELIHGQVVSSAFWISILTWAIQEYVKSLVVSFVHEIKMKWRKK